ncbi:MAG: tripartite tricarboxylate transporter substrate binding protein [Rhizobiales bacterium]|nr:tripartite tricarboxylate transporter substrate binding protein [Hyphomicrobiales bacterium]
MRMPSWVRTTAIAISGFFAILSPALAQYPDKPIKFIVPSAAGGSPDVISRLLATELQKQLGQPVIIENRPGAAGNIGLDIVAKAAPDGYTIGYGNVNTLAINKFLFTKLPVNVDKEIVPVAPVLTTYNLLVVNNDLPIRSVKELIEYAKANPDRTTAGSAGNGTTGHMSVELFKVMSGTKVAHLPYRGSPQALVDLMGGTIQMMFDNVSSAGTLAQSGKIRAIGVTAKSRIPSMPNVPTLDEAGLPGYYMASWGGVIVPAGTPQAIVNRLNAEINKALASDAIKQGFSAIGVDPFPGSQAEFRAFIAQESTRWAEVVKASGAKLD